MDWKNTKVLVTGGSGFIGSYLVDLLCSLGATVIIFDTQRPMFGEGVNVKFTKGDITNSQEISNAVQDCDIVFHLAGMLGTHELMSTIEKAIQVNCVGALNVMESCLKHGCKIVYISKPNIWLNPYSTTKHCSEGIMHVYQVDRGLQGVTIKLPTVFGGRQPLEDKAKYRKAIPTWISKCFRNEPIEIYGTGNHRIPLIYVKDVVKMILEITQMEAWDNIFKFTSFQVGSTKVMRTKELARFIKKTIGSSSRITFKAMPFGEEMYRRVPSYPKQVTLAWPSRVEFESNLRATITWYRVNSQF